MRHSVLFCLNFLLAKMLKDRLKDEEDRKKYDIAEIQAKKQVDVTVLVGKKIYM